MWIQPALISYKKITSTWIKDFKYIMKESQGGWRSLVGCSPWGRWLSGFAFTFHFHALEKELAAHSSVLAWRIPGTGEPGGLPSMGSHRVGLDWSSSSSSSKGSRENNGQLSYRYRGGNALLWTQVPRDVQEEIDVQLHEKCIVQCV